MGRAIMYYSYSSIHVINDCKAILWLSALMRTIFAAVYSGLMTTYLALSDCFEGSDPYYETVNTHNYGAKIMLMNRLHNR